MINKTLLTIFGTVRNFLGGHSIVQVADGIFIGNHADARNIRAMRRLGIDAVLNVAHEVYDPVLPQAEFVQAKYGLVDGPHEDNALMLDWDIRTLKRWTKSGKKVLVHCYLGQNRAPYVVSKYFAEKKGSCWQDEFEAIQKLRPEAYIKGWMS